MSREPLFMIWIRPVRGTGWYCCGFPIPAGQKEKENIVMNCTVTDDLYILIKLKGQHGPMNMTMGREKPTQT